ncbi:MAG: hypothetical protein ACREKL_07710 [Chthoniobacterales bacterium]
MDEEENDGQPPFQWNWQAVFMVCFFAIALAIPLAGVVLLGKGYFEPRPVAKPAAEVDTKALALGLEKLSDDRFSTTLDVKNSVVLEVAAGDMNARIQRIAEIARAAGGSALEMSQWGAKSRRVVVTIPASRIELMTRAIRGDSVDFSAIPAGANTDVLEVELKAP